VRDRALRAAMDENGDPPVIGGIVLGDNASVDFHS
jgi:hypothetical protein